MNLESELCRLKAENRHFDRANGGSVTDLVITCPECGTSYKADPKAIGPNGRTVRCANCQATWFVPAPDIIAKTKTPSGEMKTAAAEGAGQDMADAIALKDDLQSEEPALVTPLKAPKPDGRLQASEIQSSSSDGVKGADVMLRDQADAVRLKRRKRTIRLIWIITALLSLAAIVTAYLNRQEIVNRYPQAASLYQSLGLEVREGGLTIDPPTAKTTLIEGRPVIRIEGALRNLSKEPVDLPLIEMTLHDPSGAERVQWFVEPAQTRLSAQGRLPFVTEYADPPSDVISLRYRLVSP